MQQPSHPLIQSNMASCRSWSELSFSLGIEICLSLWHIRKSGRRMSVLLIVRWALDAEGLFWQHGQQFYFIILIAALECSPHYWWSLTEYWCLRLEMAMHLCWSNILESSVHFLCIFSQFRSGFLNELLQFILKSWSCIWCFTSACVFTFILHRIKCIFQFINWSRPGLCQFG